MLTLFFHRDIIMSDFGISFEYSDEGNVILGVTKGYSTEKASESCLNEEEVSKEILIENDFYAL